MADPERQSLINKDDGNGYNSVDAVDEGTDNPGSSSSVATNEDGAYRYCKAGPGIQPASNQPGGIGNPTSVRALYLSTAVIPSSRPLV